MQTPHHFTHTLVITDFYPFRLLHCLLLLYFLGNHSPHLFAQGPLERSVQVSARVQQEPPRIDFEWAWDWSGPSYTVYRKSTTDTTWGEARAILPWHATTWSDTSVEVGQRYEYAFFKKRWSNILDTICIPAGTDFTFTIHNIYGDGLCCNFGFGGYTLRACGELIASGSDFGFTQSHTSTACRTGEDCTSLIVEITPDMLPNNTWWMVTNTDTGELIADSGEPRTNLAERAKYGFIETGIAVPPIEYRGTILVLRDDFFGHQIDAEFNQLEQDFVADGWRVKTLKVNRHQSVEAIKKLIQNTDTESEDLEAILLLGHIPVPYSGNFYADGHSENHWGAWAADAFYADLDGDWTDEQVNNSSAAFARNHNLIGDGKYDQSALPSKVELAVGRIDFFDMPAFKKDEIALMRQYLQRLHLFKTGQLAVQRRSLVDDHLGSVLGAPAASAYRNFAAMFGATQIHTGDYFTDMATEDYLWSYGAGGGSHVSADGIGRTSDFARVPLQNIFTMLCGSQFGDWDNTDNFLRAPLAGAGHTLASCWVGNPPWTLHQMALGQYIGYCLRQTQNATIDDYHPGPQLVHTALMGDPTLRLHPVAMPREVSAVMDNEDVLLTWKPSADTSVLGYHVYRRHPSHSSYERLSAAPIRNTQFWDKNPSASPVQYLVKAVKLEQSGSGTYYNLSLGAAATAIATTVVSERNSDDENWVIYPNPTTGHIVLQDKTGIQVADRPEVYDSTGRLLHELRVHAESNWRLDLSSGVYFIKWKGQTKTIVVVEP